MRHGLISQQATFRQPHFIFIICLYFRYISCYDTYFIIFSRFVFVIVIKLIFCFLHCPFLPFRFRDSLPEFPTLSVFSSFPLLQHIMYVLSFFQQCPLLVHETQRSKSLKIFQFFLIYSSLVSFQVLFYFSLVFKC